MANRPQNDADPAHDARRLRDLEERLAQRTAPPAPAGAQASFSQAEKAWRMVIELVAGIVIGGGLGYGLDWVLGTRPVFLVLFILLGFVAGMKTVIRTAKELAPAGPQTDETGPRANEDKGDDRGR